MRDVTSGRCADTQLGLVGAEVRQAKRWIAAPNVPRTELDMHSTIGEKRSGLRCGFVQICSSVSTRCKIVGIVNQFMSLFRSALVLVCAAIAALGCRDPNQTLPSPIPSSVASVITSASVAPSAPAITSSASTDEAPEPIGGIVRSPLGPDAPEKCPTSGEFPQVITRAGNIVLCTSAGEEEPLTTEGHDGAPSLSPKRDSVLFLRNVGQMKVSVYREEFVSIHDNRVMVIDLKGRKVQEVGRPSDKEACLSLSGPRWLDDAAILVQSNGYEAATIHNLSLCLVDVRTRQIVNIARRTGCAIPITVGKYKGNIFVAPWNFRVGEGLSSWFGVVNRRGKSLREFEDNPFERDWNGDGNIMNEEMSPECMDLSVHREQVEKIMKSW